MPSDPKRNAGMPAELRAYAKTEPHARLVEPGHTAEFRAALAAANELRVGAKPAGEARQAQARAGGRALAGAALLLVGLLVAVAWRVLLVTPAPPVATPTAPPTAPPVAAATIAPTAARPPPSPTFPPSLPSPTSEESAEPADRAKPPRTPEAPASVAITSPTAPIAAPPKPSTPSTPATSAPQATSTALGGPRTFGN